MSASTDITKLLKGLVESNERARAAAIKAVDDFGDAKVLGDAQDMCPKLTGFLAASGNSEPATVDAGGEVTKQIGFNASYAAAVHERLDVHHPNGQAKFLEASVRNNQPKLAPFIADRVKKALG